jgi:TPR repeat protein
LVATIKGILETVDAKEKERLAAEQREKERLYHLGESYEYGQGVAQDDGKAREWYQKAAEAGNEDAKRALSRLSSPKFWSTVKRIFKS